MPGKTIADINNYLHKALLSAGRFAGEETSQILRYQRSQTHYAKYFDLFEQRLFLKIGLFLAPFAHLFSVAQEGIAIQPVTIELAQGAVPEGWEFVASLLIVAILFWCSLGVGHFLHNVEIRTDELVPGRYRIKNPMALIAALLTAILYLWILYQMLRIARDLAGEYHYYTTFILIFGLVELLLGYLAISGWELIIAYVKQAWLRGAFRRGENRLFNYAKQCSHNYRFFLQGRELLDASKQKVFLNQSSFEKVQVAVEYYQRYMGQRKNIYLLE